MLAERRIADELMDDPSLPPETYRAVLADLAAVNRITLAHRPTLNFVSGAIGSREKFSLLDVGYGQGDMLRAIALWAQKRGITANLTGIDLNAGSAPAARASTPDGMNIDYQTGDYRDLTGGYDLIVSSLVAHHMTRPQLVEFLQFMDREALIGWFVNDLHRHTLSYLGYPLLARIMGWHEIVRRDGQTSIARAFRPADWDSLLAESGAFEAAIQRHFPFRLCVAKTR